MTDIQDIIDYYVNLIIIQYNNKPKARETVDTLVSSALANGITLDVANGFNIDTAVGVQLDILGKYIGIDRFFLSDLLTDDYFGFEDATNIGGVSDNIVGFDDAASPDKVGLFLDAENIIADTLSLNDATYRTLLKLKIIQNHSNHSFESIADGIYDFFDDDIIVKDNYDMTMTYLIGNASINLVKAALEKEVFPRPIGVRLQAINGNKFFGMVDATNLFIPDYLTGFNDATDGLIKDGRFLNANNDIIQ